YTPFRGHEDKVRAMAFSPDGRLIASGADDRTVRMWEVATGRVVAVLRGHEKPVSQVVFSPDGRRLASTDINDRAVRLWDPTAGALVALLSDQLVEPHALTFSPDSRFVSVAGGRDVYLWEATTGKLRQTIRHGSRNRGHLAFAPDGKRLFGS